MSWDEIKKAINDDISVPLNRLIGRKAEFYSNGTFVVPEGITSIYITAAAGGGAGGVGYNSIGGTGGGGGDCIIQQKFAVTPGTQLAIVVGSGGVATATAGGAGGTTSVGSLVSLSGGGGGNFSNAGTAVGGAAGGPGGGKGGSYYENATGSPGMRGKGGPNITGSGYGGGGSFGDGAAGAAPATPTTLNAGAFGSGGSGGVPDGTGAGYAASNGGAGFVWITWGLAGYIYETEKKAAGTPLNERTSVCVKGTGATGSPWNTYYGEGEIALLPYGTAMNFNVKIDSNAQFVVSLYANGSGVTIPFKTQVMVGALAGANWVVTTW